MENCLEFEGIPKPEEGSGKKGRVLKPDLVDKLIEHVLTGCTQEQKDRVRKNLVGETQPEVSEEDEILTADCPTEILKLVRDMDTENRDHFKNVIEQATVMLQKIAEKNEEKKIREAVKQTLAKKAEEAKEQKPKEAVPATGSEPPGPGSGVAKAGGPHAGPSKPKQHCPAAFLNLCPPLSPGLFFVKWEPGRRRIQVIFPKLAGFQKSKSQSWKEGASIVEIGTACWVVWDFARAMYHTHFKEGPFYDRAYAMPSSQMLEDAIREAG